MKRIYVLLICLIAATAWADIDQISGQSISGLDQIAGQTISGIDQAAGLDLPSGSACSTTYYHVNQNDISGSTGRQIASDGQQRGNAFGGPTSSTQLKGIDLYINTNTANETQTLTIRIGTSTDLTSSYTEATAQIGAGATGWVSVDFESAALSLTNTTYYFLAGWSGADADNDDIYLAISAADVLTSYLHVYSTTADWTAESSSSTYDLSFRIELCGSAP